MTRDIASHSDPESKKSEAVDGGGHLTPNKPGSPALWIPRSSASRSGRSAPPVARISMRVDTHVLLPFQDKPIDRLYTAADLPADWSDAQSTYLGVPGAPPYTRGIHPRGYRGGLWTMRQFFGFATAEETNLRYKYLLQNGGDRLSVAFDLPTLMGCDSDDSQSEGEVGKCGVAIDSLEDMEILFDGIDLEKTTVSMTINSPASVLWAMYLVTAEKRGPMPRKFQAHCRTISFPNTLRRRSTSIRPLPPCVSS